MRDGAGGGIVIYRQAHQLGTGFMQLLDLRHGCGDIRGIGIGHRLHHDRGVASDYDPGNVNGMPVLE